MAGEKQKAEKEKVNDWLGNFCRMMDVQAEVNKKMIADFNVANPPDAEVSHEFEGETVTYGIWFLEDGSAMYGVRRRGGYQPAELQTLPPIVVESFKLQKKPAPGKIAIDAVISALKEISRDAWSGEKVRMNSIGQMADELIEKLKAK